MTQEIADSPATATIAAKLAWAMVREITNRLDRIVTVVEELGATNQMRPLRTNKAPDVKEPPDSIRFSIMRVTPLNLAELRAMTNEPIVNGDLVLESVVGTVLYRGVLTASNMHGTTVLTRIP
jgi:hypothetical protein